MYGTLFEDYLFFKIILFNSIIQVNWIKKLIFILENLTGFHLGPKLGS